MTAPTADPATASPTAAPATTWWRHPIVRDAGVVLGWFLVLGLVGALVWWQVTPLAEFTRTATNAEMDEAELGRQVATDGWYAVIAVVGGVLSGITLLAWRKRDPLLTVVLVAAGAMVAAWVMLRVGLWLGPADPKDALKHAAVGTTVPIQLKTHASGVLFIWPVAALIGALGVLWGLDERHPKGAEPAKTEPVDSPESAD